LKELATLKAEMNGNQNLEFQDLAILEKLNATKPLKKNGRLSRKSLPHPTQDIDVP